MAPYEPVPFATIVRDGTPEMGGFPDLSEAEVEAIRGFIESLR